jgi:hypothetical protein
MSQENAVDRNYEWFKENLADLLLKYDKQQLVIIDEKVAGVYSSFEEALEGALALAKPGEFIIQKCALSEDEATEVICSLVRLPKAI